MYTVELVAPVQFGECLFRWHCVYSRACGTGTVWRVPVSVGTVNIVALEAPLLSVSVGTVNTVGLVASVLSVSVGTVNTVGLVVPVLCR